MKRNAKAFRNRRNLETAHLVAKTPEHEGRLTDTERERRLERVGEIMGDETLITASSPVSKIQSGLVKDISNQVLTARNWAIRMRRREGNAVIVSAVEGELLADEPAENAVGVVARILPDGNMDGITINRHFSIAATETSTPPLSIQKITPNDGTRWRKAVALVESLIR